VRSMKRRGYHCMESCKEMNKYYYVAVNMVAVCIVFVT